MILIKVFLKIVNTRDLKSKIWKCRRFRIWSPFLSQKIFCYIVILAGLFVNLSGPVFLLWSIRRGFYKSIYISVYQVWINYLFIYLLYIYPSSKFKIMCHQTRKKIMTKICLNGLQKIKAWNYFWFLTPSTI